MAKKRKLNSKNPKYHTKDKNEQVEKKRILMLKIRNGNIDNNVEKH